MSKKRTLNDFINEEIERTGNSVIVTLFYKPELEPKDMKTADKNIRKFISEVEKTTYKKIDRSDRFYVFFKEQSGIRSLIWLKTVSLQEAQSFNIKKCWKKGKMYISEVDSVENTKRMFESMKARVCGNA